MPPVLILHGERDRLVSVDKARKLERALKAKNLAYEIKLYATQGHGFTGHEAQDAFERTFKFLDKHLTPKAE
jgi:dipeptidyl aminopeptidase/acylaminoacyl peptidase